MRAVRPRPLEGATRPSRLPDWEVEFRTPAPREFFDRPTEEVARDLIGCIIIRRAAGAWRAARIVETEAYVARDPANHAYRGETERNRSMFLGPGHLYVYRIHQVHCANTTTSPGEGVLLRAAEPLTELGDQPRGPGLLCRAFQIDRDHDGLDLVHGPVRILPRGEGAPRLQRTSRVGIRSAVRRPLRFLDAASPWVSKGRPSARRSKRAPGRGA